VRRETTMTDWKNHHPPHDHPDFDAYLDTLTDDDLDAINAAMPTTDNDPPATRHDLEK